MRILPKRRRRFCYCKTYLFFFSFLKNHNQSIIFFLSLFLQQIKKNIKKKLSSSNQVDNLCDQLSIDEYETYVQMWNTRISYNNLHLYTNTTTTTLVHIACILKHHRILNANDNRTLVILTRDKNFD